MRPIFGLLALLSAATPAMAQDGWTPPLADQAPRVVPEPGAEPEAEEERGLDLIERGAGLLFQQLLDDASPHLDRMGRDLSGALSQFAPAMNDLAALVDDIGNYEAPERLENGDILIRRRADAPPPPDLPELAEPDTETPRERAPVPVDPYAPEVEL
ncbi:hypothetical protein MLD63_14105 [Paracoccus sp. TK19116]|uniref:AAA+ family ATPase n=2 Tax=Paracoccus albicereus TaxID=2922394 RepID=A0ABT1MV51_9RHOB|nr:hypothetical protein [Paracoccus albicereus]